MAFEVLSRTQKSILEQEKKKKEDITIDIGFIHYLTVLFRQNNEMHVF
jgi:hypothetical protein